MKRNRDYTSKTTHKEEKQKGPRLRGKKKRKRREKDESNLKKKEEGINFTVCQLAVT